MRIRRTFAVAAVAVGSLIAISPVSANWPSNVSATQSSRYISASWSLPLGVHSRQILVSGDSGFVNPPVYWADLNGSDTAFHAATQLLHSYTAPDTNQLPPGTWWVAVAGCDDNDVTCYSNPADWSLEDYWELSDPASVQLPTDPPPPPPPPPPPAPTVTTPQPAPQDVSKSKKSHKKKCRRGYKRTRKGKCRRKHSGARATSLQQLGAQQTGTPVRLR